MTVKAIRGTFFDFVDDPWKYVGNEKKAARFFHDGLLVVDKGKIVAYGDYGKLSSQYSSVSA